MIKGGMHYIEVKKLLLLSYCQAISFYLILKSEGQPVHDHPVISRLVEIKNLLNKVTTHITGFKQQNMAKYCLPVFVNSVNDDIVCWKISHLFMWYMHN